MLCVRMTVLAIVVALVPAVGAAPALADDATPKAGAEANADSDAWTEVDRSKEGFRAEFPGEPERTVESFGTALGKIKASRFVWEDATEHFSVEHHLFPTLARALAPASLILSKTRDSILEGRDAEEISFEEIEGAAHPTRVLLLRSRDGRSPVERTVLTLVGRRLYMATAETGEDASALSRARHFFDAFEIQER